MAFGQAAAPSGDKEISFERRDLVFVSQEDKVVKTGPNAGKPFWRVKDNVGKGRYYTVWDGDILARMQDLQGENQTPVPCVVKIEKQGDSTFYSITDCGAAAEQVAAASNQQAQASRQPGGKLSEYGKRMHPDDALRVTNLALIERALHMLEITVEDRAEGMTRELYIKGKLMPTMQFMNGVIDLPKTQTPDAPAAKAEEAPATQKAAGFGDAPLDTDQDGDIPF
jgi:hypothetical protein